MKSCREEPVTRCSSPVSESSKGSGRHSRKKKGKKKIMQIYSFVVLFAHV